MKSLFLCVALLLVWANSWPLAVAHVHAPVDFSKIQPLIQHPNPPSAPQQIHVVFGATGEYVVSWVSFDAAQPQKSVVEYGISTSGLSHTSAAQPFVFTDDRCGTKRVMHNVAIRQIAPPGKPLFYRVSSDGLFFSPIFNFTVVDRENQMMRPLTVSLVGDMTVPPISKNSSIIQWTRDTQRGVHDLVLHYGDIGYNLDENCNQIGDYYMQQAQPVGAFTPYVFGVGNHETDKDYSYSTYLNRYAGQSNMARASNSNSVRWFSFDVQLVHFVFFDTDAWIYPEVYHLAKPQLEWMRADLAKVDRSKTPWVIVIGHRAMYCTKNTDPECNGEAETIRNGLYVNSTQIFGGVEPLLLEFGVDLYFAGHTHHYMRTWPVKRAQLNQKSYVNPTAPVHVQSGIGGIDGDDPFSLPMKSYDAWRDMTYRNSFSRLIVYNATQISFTQRTSWDGSVFDSFDLVQTRHGGPF